MTDASRSDDWDGARLERWLSAASLREHCEAVHHLPHYGPGKEIVTDAKLERWHRHEHAVGVYEPHSLWPDRGEVYLDPTEEPQ